jgi:hypothetical protein
MTRAAVSAPLCFVGCVEELPVHQAHRPCTAYASSSTLLIIHTHSGFVPPPPSYIALYDNMSNSPSNSQTAFAVKPDRSDKQDLLDIGQRCSLSTCNLVDFLPIKCLHCKAPYCQEHFQPDKHTCEKWDARAADRRALECESSIPVRAPFDYSCSV